MHIETRDQVKQICANYNLLDNSSISSVLKRSIGLRRLFTN